MHHRHRRQRLKEFLVTHGPMEPGVVGCRVAIKPEKTGDEVGETRESSAERSPGTTSCQFYTKASEQTRRQTAPTVTPSRCPARW